MAKASLGRKQFDEWCREHSEDPTDPLHEEGFRGLMAYEDLLKREHGWRVRAQSYLGQIRADGFIGSTEARVLGRSRAGSGH
jgi:hypothetical protein